MINDVKSTHYISWTELGTSFVVSNVGEFSRSILGSHFKHNNVCHSSLLFLSRWDPVLEADAFFSQKLLDF